MKIDWDRRTCARRGHITYRPQEDDLREKLHATTALGEAWRCLRCGDFALGEPHGSGPAADAPLVPRGKVLRDLFILRFLAVERAIRGVFIVLAAVGVWQFSNRKDAVRRFFDEYIAVLRPVARHFHYDLDHSPVVGTIQKTFGYQHSTLMLVAALLLVYALVEIIEGVGLWRAKRWAEYLTVVATAAFLPLEIYELSEKISWLKIATLVINILAVLYIAVTKRLFGLRGGRRAFDEERQSASLLEVETSAGVPAPAHNG
ncbi:DUF2127 domain-containing protein [Streptomyces sp. NPDC048650]|uniref:DUF2127 domain-containing protein n=1 Tax=unclassified Streptomyces TaxID=2593676 RepID=UPI003723A5E0